MAPGDKEVGAAAPTIAALARSFGAVAATIAQALVRAAGDAISSAVDTVFNSTREGSSAEPSPGLRAIVGGAAARARRKQDGAPTDSERSLPPEPATLAADDDGTRLDANPDEDTMVVLPRDPRSLYAYWHLGAASRARREELLRDGSGLLHDALLVEVEADDAREDAAGTEFWIVPLPLLAESCHVELGRARGRARVVLGLHAEGSGFTPLAAAPAITLPPSGDGDVAAPRWRRLPFGPEHDGAAPVAPRREASDQLASRAREHDHASSDAAPRSHDAGGQQRNAAVRRPA